MYVCIYTSIHSCPYVWLGTNKAPYNNSGHQSVGVTTGGHSVTASKATTGVTRSTVSNYSHQSTGATYGGHPVATSNTVHQPTGVTKMSVKEDHYTSSPDQGIVCMQVCAIQLCIYFV